MARNRNNLLLTGLSGKLGRQLVFRQYRHQTVVAVAPGSYNRVATPAQAAARSRMIQAAAYGRAILSDAVSRAVYAERAAKAGRSVYHVAVADCLHAPCITGIDVSGYNGLPGSLLRVQATDDFEVTTVEVQIDGPDGSVVESGTATLQVDGLTWIYTAQATLPLRAGSRIICTAKDRPGNTGVAVEVLEG
jgi:hypothetical protein